MPKTTSAKKAARQNIRRRAQNLERKQSVKAVIKELRELIKEKKGEDAKKHLAKVYKTIDKMAKVNFIKKGKANRLKSRLAKRVQF